MAEYTTYWRPERVRDNLGRLIEHIAENKLHDAKAGDAIWIVNVRKGVLHLVARIQPTEVCDQKSAGKRLPYTPWPAKYHFLCPPGHAEQARLVPVGDDAWRLTFDSPKSPKLVPNRGKVRAQQLRRPRKLTPDGAAILKRVWDHGTIVSVVDIPPTARRSIPDLDDDLPVTGKEGKKQWYRHLRRERNRKLAKRKKQIAQADNRRLLCEACGFDFRETFGLVNFCEVHHRLPLSKGYGVRETKLQDLSILCANCHRAIHRLGPPMPTVPELRSLLQKNRKASPR